jgi:nucleotide-binding universal stress UspA family protein
MNYPFQGDVIKEMKKQAKVNYLKWVAKIADHEAIFTFHSEQNAVVSEIINFIEKQKIDLVVMGTQGASGLTEFFVGSNTEKVVRFSQVPVFSIKKSVKFSFIKNIVFPTQLGLNETSLVNEVKDLQAHFKAHLHIVYVNTPANFKNSEVVNGLMEDYIKHYRFENFSSHIISDIYEQPGINAYTKELSGTIIAMGTHSRKGLSHFFTGSIAEDLVNHGKCPIWTYSIKK